VGEGVRGWEVVRLFHDQWPGSRKRIGHKPTELGLVRYAVASGRERREVHCIGCLAAVTRVRVFWLAYVLARQASSPQLPAAKTNTPLNALFRGVFRFYLLTSPTPQMSFLADFGALRAVSLETS